MKMKIVGLIVIFSIIIFAQSKTTIAVATAQSLAPVIKELKIDFEKRERSIELMLITGSSEVITKQIEGGADFDIFISSDTASPEKLWREGFGLERSKIYAKGSLILFSKKKADLSKGITVLRDAAVRRIAIPNPQFTPYGIAAMESITRCGLKDTITPKLIMKEDVNEVAEQSLKSVEAAFLPKSMLSDELFINCNEKDDYWIDVDPASYNPIHQGIIIIKSTAQKDAAKTFVDYVMSDKAKKIFAKY